MCHVLGLDIFRNHGREHTGQLIRKTLYSCYNLIFEKRDEIVLVAVNQPSEYLDCSVEELDVLCRLIIHAQKPKLLLQLLMDAFTMLSHAEVFL